MIMLLHLWNGINMPILDRIFKKNGNKPVETPKPAAAPYLIQLVGLKKTYISPGGSFTALKGIDLTVDRGEFVAIVGKSGCGKSTLINMITGIDQPSAGEIWVDHTAVHTLTEEQIALWRGKSIGVIFQFFQLLPTLTAVENVMLPMDYSNKYPPEERPDRAMALLGRLAMAASAHRLPAELSGGEQQSIAVARALANDPPIIVADEPTGNLDTRSADRVFNLFGDLVADGKTVLMVTHDRDLAKRTRRIVTLADGLIVAMQELQPLSNGKRVQEKQP